MQIRKITENVFVSFFTESSAQTWKKKNTLVKKSSLLKGKGHGMSKIPSDSAFLSNSPHCRTESPNIGSGSDPSTPISIHNAVEYKTH